MGSVNRHSPTNESIMSVSSLHLRPDRRMDGCVCVRSCVRVCVRTYGWVDGQCGIERYLTQHVVLFDSFDEYLRTLPTNDRQFIFSRLRITLDVTRVFHVGIFPISKSALVFYELDAGKQLKRMKYSGA